MVEVLWWWRCCGGGGVVVVEVLWWWRCCNGFEKAGGWTVRGRAQSNLTRRRLKRAKGQPSRPLRPHPVNDLPSVLMAGVAPQLRVQRRSPQARVRAPRLARGPAHRPAGRAAGWLARGLAEAAGAADVAAGL